jgi:DNA-binding Lrp family transcriptional regulator
VYFRNNTGNPLTNYSDLAERWGISKASVSRILNKLQEKEYLSLVSFTGRHGSVIYLCNYLSTMFSVSDVMIDKEEVSMAFQIPVQLMENVFQEDSTIKDEQIMIEEDSVSNEEGSVSDFNIRAMVRKVAKILSAQGVSCCECPRTQYKLYSLSDCKEGNLKYSLSINCPDGKIPYQFELTLTSAEMEQSHEEKGGKERYE